MNIGVYVSLLNDEHLIKYCYQALIKKFPQTMVIDFGSTDDSRIHVPHKHLIQEAITDPQQYIDLKNYYSNKHDRVFWVDADEIYPESSLKYLEFLLHTKRERVISCWRSVRVDPDGTIRIEKPFIRGFSAWATATNQLAKAWPNEVLVNIDPDWRQPKRWNDTKVWCWHGVLLNRSSQREPTSRYKKRLHRLQESQVRDRKQRVHDRRRKRNYRVRGSWSIYQWLPWGDEDVKKYVPIPQNIKSKKKRG